MSMSAGNVWRRPLRLTRTARTVPAAPLTLIVDGYGLASAMPATRGVSWIAIGAGCAGVAVAGAGRRRWIGKGAAGGSGLPACSARGGAVVGPPRALHDGTLDLG